MKELVGVLKVLLYRSTVNLHVEHDRGNYLLWVTIPAVALAESDGNLVSGQNLMVLGPLWPLIIQGFDAAGGWRNVLLWFN
jgi:hypothetical protein